MPAPQTVYIEAPEPVFAVLHMPDAPAARDTSVILCPPLGWDETCSYRSRREWAQRLAQDGYPSLRLSLPGTGDSAGSPRDPARLEVWTAAVAAAARWLQVSTATARLAAIGIGSGGLIAYRAAAGALAIDDLVLWATPASGRALVRELRAFSRLEAPQFLLPGIEPPPSQSAGELEAAGFLLSEETVGDLGALDLTALPMNDPPPGRALLLERDGMAVDGGLRDRLTRCGADVTIGPGDGYTEMTAHPQQARAPLELIARVTAWLDEASASAPTHPDAALPEPSRARSIQLELAGGALFKETTLSIDQPFGELTAVLAEPLGARPSDLCAVLLNAGAVRRIGPSRMWVEVARRWAARGVPTLRLDVEGLGDADGDASGYVQDAGFFRPQLTAQVRASLDHLVDLGVARHFVVGGLCSGAYWSFQLALEDPRVRSVLMLNPRALIWSSNLVKARDFRRGILRPSNWRKVRSVSRGRLLAAVGWALSAPLRLAATRGRRRARDGEEIGELFNRLQASGQRVMLLFSDNEPLHEELLLAGLMTRLERSTNVTVERIMVRDHTLRPRWAQRQAHLALDRALERELARATGVG